MKMCLHDNSGSQRQGFAFNVPDLIPHPLLQTPLPLASKIKFPIKTLMLWILMSILLWELMADLTTLKKLIRGNSIYVCIVGILDTR